jgi:hypothetical protein
MGAPDLAFLQRLKTIRTTVAAGNFSSAKQDEHAAREKWELAQSAAVDCKKAGSAAQSLLHPRTTNLTTATLANARSKAVEAKLIKDAKILQADHVASQKKTIDAQFKHTAASKSFEKTSAFLKSYTDLASKQTEASEDMDADELRRSSRPTVEIGRG